VYVCQRDNGHLHLLPRHPDTELVARFRHVVTKTKHFVRLLNNFALGSYVFCTLYYLLPVFVCLYLLIFIVFLTPVLFWKRTMEDSIIKTTTSSVVTG